MEHWKDIEGFEGRYQISDYGRVKSVERSCEMPTGRRRIIPERIRVPARAHGYLYCELWKDNEHERRAVHRMVATAFIPNPKGLPCVNHLDGDKQNNNVHNLEWCTYSENNVHAFASGLHVPYDRRGSRNPMYGKHHGEKAKEKIAAVHRGTTHSAETKIKMSKARKGKTFTEAHKRHLAESVGKAKKGTRVVVKDGVRKIAKGEKLQQYLSSGWEYARKGKH